MFQPYLTLKDYLPAIQRGQLVDQILSELEDGTDERQFTESWAMEKIRSKLGDKYDLDVEFTPTKPHEIRPYTAGERCVIDFPTWIEKEEGDRYEQNSLVSYEGYGYICLGEPASILWDESEWQILGRQGTIYYIPYPAPKFSLNIGNQNGLVQPGFYLKGDIVFFNGHTWECIIQTTPTSREVSINYPSYQAIPAPNRFPQAGTGYWNDLGAYLVEGYPFFSEDPDNISVWKQGDNRDPLLVQAVVDLALFQLHKRIAPNNIPTLRLDAMKTTFAWLQSVSDGYDSMRIQKLQPLQGKSFSGGGKPRYRNSW